MFNKPDKSFVPPAINSTFVFDLYTRAGRDDIATQIHKDMVAYCEQFYSAEERRHHLGISEVGHNCSRYTMYRFRWCVEEKFNGRMLLLFMDGHLFEQQAIEILSGIGFNITSHTVDGKQVRVARRVRGHFGGSIDSKTILPARYGNFPDEFLVEFKTANLNWFKKIEPMGFVKGKPQHWAQACCYGKALGLKYVLYICKGKNDSELDVEIEELDWTFAEEQERKAEFIILNNQLPARLSNNPSFWECRYCPAIAVCHYGAPPDKNCRSCRYAEPIENGEWGCHYYHQQIPKDFIPQGCDSWVPLT